MKKIIPLGFKYGGGLTPLLDSDGKLCNWRAVMAKVFIDASHSCLAVFF